jgi:hypothetical protein
MEFGRLQQLIADPQNFFADTHNFVFLYFLVMFGIFTAARVMHLSLTIALPVALALIFLLILLQNRILTPGLPLLLFATMGIVALVLAIRFVQGYIQRFLQNL